MAKLARFMPHTEGLGAPSMALSKRRKAAVTAALAAATLAGGGTYAVNTSPTAAATWNVASSPAKTKAVFDCNAFTGPLTTGDSGPMLMWANGQTGEPLAVADAGIKARPKAPLTGKGGAAFGESTAADALTAKIMVADQGGDGKPTTVKISSDGGGKDVLAEVADGKTACIAASVPTGKVNFTISREDDGLSPRTPFASKAIKLGDPGQTKRLGWKIAGAR